MVGCRHIRKYNGCEKCVGKLEICALMILK